MENCFLELSPKTEDSFFRIKELFEVIKNAKESGDTPDEYFIAEQFQNEEKAYFWNPSAEEQNEWNAFWFSTPVSIRHSPQMPTPQWDFESMLDAFWNGDYDLIDIRQIDTKFILEFYPHGYPYGGVGCMVAFLECLSCEVLLIYDGSQDPYIPVKNKNVWRSKSRTSTQQG